MSELLFNAKMSNLSAISWREQVTSWWDDDDDVRFVLDQHVELDFYRAIYSSLKQHSTSGHVVLLAYVILIPIKAYFLVLRS